MRAAILIAALALAGCQSAAEKHAAETGEIEAANASMDEISGLLDAAQSRNGMKPGLWNVTLAVESSDFSMLPADSRDAQLAALKRQERNTTKCAKADELKTLDIEDLGKVAGQCTFPRFIQKSGRLDVEIRCTQGQAVTVVRQKGTISPTGYDVTVDQASGQPGQPGYAAFRLHAKGQRLGACVSGG